MGVRKRYSIVWNGSSTSLLILKAELYAFQGEVLDATRISDGAQVVLKFVEPISADTEVSRFLTNEPGAPDYCILTLDLLAVDDELSIMVMPRMHDCINPRFETVGEVVEFIRRVLEVRDVAARCLRAEIMTGPRIPSRQEHRASVRVFFCPTFEHCRRRSLVIYAHKTSSWMPHA